MLAKLTSALTSTAVLISTATIFRTAPLTVGTAAAKKNTYCELDRYGRGTRDCQCYNLQNHLVTNKRVLLHLMKLNVCPLSNGSSQTSIVQVSTQSSQPIPPENPPCQSWEPKGDSSRHSDGNSRDSDSSNNW